MSDATLLPELLRRESRSYLQYVRESFPWAKSDDARLRAEIMALADAENAEISHLGRLLQRKRIALPFLGAFPTSYTTSNFIAAAFLLPRLLTDEKRKLAELERDIGQINDAEVRAQVEAYRERKLRHIQVLEALPGASKAA